MSRNTEVLTRERPWGLDMTHPWRCEKESLVLCKKSSHTPRFTPRLCCAIVTASEEGGRPIQNQEGGLSTLFHTQIPLSHARNLQLFRMSICTFWPKSPFDWFCFGTKVISTGTTTGEVFLAGQLSRVWSPTRDPASCRPAENKSSCIQNVFLWMWHPGQAWQETEKKCRRRQQDSVCFLSREYHLNVRVKTNTTPFSRSAWKPN